MKLCRYIFVAACVLWLSLVPAAAADNGNELLPADVVAVVERADSAIAHSEWALAESLLSEAIALRPGDPGNVLLLSNLGIVRHQLGNNEGALEALTDAHCIAPVSVTVLNNRARVLLAMGRKDDAVADYEEVMRLDSTLTEPYFYRGMVAFSIGDLEAAEADFEHLRSVDPDGQPTLVALAALHTARGQNEEALSLYRKLVDISPDAEYYSGLIENQLALERLSEAAETIAKAIESYPVDPDFYVFRALLNKRRYLYDDARDDARRAVSLGANAAQVNALLNSY